ncbi:hypothetical protein ASPVEDRAFT_38888 [Aspergillus versicolor CBS 583.65]|uniref:Zn(2)-C6 fungal-type domain-containing protein n=1 Tax=Aspergillus versicolor CBS 583.65 TaxID=1036611 RepID=A0A1L9PDD7_ASPVE|nr:uncharacterized protein ASPVEDRAFT_38888 [Aspergillus versicolor CBS 583.65]OJI99475.1 hypothetical protein ASPVEDRAFT_38888 [Aspergillus versicolor CBS 583.65]
MASDLSNGRLACTHCRRRKVRCNRALPSCERCLLHQFQCSYPNRQRRTTRKTVQTQEQHAVLPPLIERLRAEQAENVSDARDTIDNPDRDGSSGPRAGSPASRGVNVPLNETTLDVTSILSSAVDKVQQLRKKHRFGVRALTLEPITISPERAKQWIYHYFTNIEGKLLPALVDRKLIDIMPDLIDMDHVHIDPCMLIIYYCILWQGLFFHKGSPFIGIDNHDARQVFICCKRTIPIWQREATGTVTDFIAAMYMTQTATENFDFGLSWEMHKLACEYAQTLQMHSLDSLDHHPGGLSMSDHDRMGMWWLIHLDLFARLINDKPAVFSSQLNEWRVNMPRLAAEFSQRNGAVPTMAFLVRSRLTFILISYFQASEALNDESDIQAAITPLCEDVEGIFEEWKMEEWLQSYKNDDINGWILSDLALSGYTCILFMLRKASLPQSSEHKAMLSDNDEMIPRSELSMRTSRKVLKLVHHMIHVVTLPGPEAMSLILGTYRAYIAHAHLASGLIHDPAAPTVDDDMGLLLEVAECIEGLAREVNEFVPLAGAFKMVNNEVRRKVQEASDEIDGDIH